jgi:hypothetical protein
VPHGNTFQNRRRTLKDACSLPRVNRQCGENLLGADDVSVVIQYTYKLYAEFYVPYRALIFLTETNKCALAKMFNCTVLCITPTCFGHSCDHLQVVIQ